jgi:hypothetical protein
MMASTRHPKTYQREPAEIERDIAQTRQAIDSTVGELGQRLAPSQLVDDARTYVKETAVRGMNTMWTRMSDNAVPLGLIGGGVAWMIASRRSRGNGYYGFEEEYEGYETGSSEGGPGLRERAREMAASGAERAREVGERVRERGHELRERSAHLGERAQERAHRVRERVDTMRDEQPLLLGIAALACGALLGGMIPATRREDRLIGEVRDQVVGAATEAGAEKLEEARQAAERTVREMGGSEQRSEQQRSDQPQQRPLSTEPPITPRAPGF